MQDPILQSSRRSEYAKAANESGNLSGRKRQQPNVHTSELTVVPQRYDLNRASEKQVTASQKTKSTLPRNIHQPLPDQRESANELTEGISIEDVISADHNHSQATHRTNLQRLPVARN